MLTLQHFFTLFPPKRLEELACEYQVDAQHSIKISGPALFLCLLNGLLNHPELSQRMLEEIYHQQTGQTLDHSTFGKCLNRINPSFFKGIFQELYAKLQPQIPSGTQSALKLRIVDATIVTLSAKLLSWGLRSGTCNPDKARQQVKSVIELSAQGIPNLLRICKEPSESADSTALGATMQQASKPGDLWVFDKGCHGRERLLGIHQAKAFWITPLSQQHVAVLQTLFVLDAQDLPVAAPKPGESTWICVRVEQVVFENSQATEPTRRKWGSMPLILVHGLRFDIRSKTWQPLILMTNLPLSENQQQAGPYTWDEIASLYHERWNIEVFFKFIKQNLNYSHLTSRSENGVEIMIYMSLIAALLLIWFKQQTGIDRGWRSVKFWLAEAVRHWTQEALDSMSKVLYDAPLPVVFAYDVANFQG